MSIYIKQSIINKSRRNNKVLEFINKQLISIGKALKESETELERFRIENNIIEPTKQSQSLLDRLSDVEVKLSQTKIEKALIDTVARKIKRDNSLDSITPTLRELGDEPTIRVIEHLQRLQRKLNELSVEFTPKHPEIIAINRDIWRSERTIQKNIKELQKNIAQKQKSLYAQKRKYENSLKTLPTKEKRLIDLQRNHQVSSKMYSYLLEKQAENKMKKVATVPDYKIIDPAYSNGSPIKPKRSMSLAISTIFSMIFASLFAYMRSSLNNRLQNIKEIRELTNLPLYAELPILENSKFLTRDSSQLLKSFRNLRTKINFNHPKQKGNVILITSSKAREGKTNIVSNLGYIFQKANYKTLIIDFDLYRPQIHNIFSLGLNVGTGEYLSAKESDVDKLIQKTKYKDLDILTAGSITEDVSELILSRRLYFLLETLKKRYNYIFIDAIPLSIEADVLYIMKYSDVNLITVQEEFTKKSFITGIQKHIGEYKFKNIAILAITNS
jgi:capsular exopolysaccharide synthesis family protein